MKTAAISKALESLADLSPDDVDITGALYREAKDAQVELAALQNLLSRVRRALLSMSRKAWYAHAGMKAVLVFSETEDGAKALACIALDEPEEAITVKRTPNQDRCNAMLLENES